MRFTRESMSKKQFLIILSIAAVMRLAQIGAALFWYDESFTWLVCSRSIPNMLLALSGDVHPPMYYLMIWPICQMFGRNEFILRLPSAILSLLALYLLWRLSRRISIPAGAQVVGLSLMAVLSVQLHFAQEFRMYTLFTCEILIAILAIIDRRWLAAGLAIGAALYTHNYAIIYAPVLALIAFIQVGYDWRRLWPGPILSFVLPCLAFTPWLFVLLNQMRQVSDGYWIQSVTVGSQLDAWNKLLWGFSMPEKVQLMAALVGFGFTLYVIGYTLIRRLGGWGLLLIMSVLPLMLASMASVVWRPILLFRGLLPSMPFFYLLSGLVIASGPMWRRVVITGMLAPIILAGIYGHYRWNPTNKGDIVTLNAVRKDWQPGDIIIHANDGSVLGWLTYGSDMQPQYKAPRCIPEPLGALSPATRAGIGYSEHSPNEFTGHRVWIVATDGPTSTGCDINRAKVLTNGARLYLSDTNTKYMRYEVWVIDKQ